MSSKKVFFNTLKSELSPRLREIGFLGSGQNFRRVRGEIINAVNIRGDRWGGRCSLNIGLHCTFLPIYWSEELSDVRRIREIDCEFRANVAPKGETDYWWEYGTYSGFAERSARHLADTYFTAGESRFQKFSSLEAIAAMYPIELLELNLAAYPLDAVFGYLPCTISRIALTMARVHEWLVNHAVASEFAIMGLNHVGRATSLIPLLQRIIGAS